MQTLSTKSPSTLLINLKKGKGFFFFFCGLIFEEKKTGEKIKEC
jgi:hypothetical protein